MLWLMTGVSAATVVMEQSRIDDLNRRFPRIGDELNEAVQKKIAQHGGELSVAELIEKLEAHPKYADGTITDAQTFGLHSELMLLYPTVGRYADALREAKLLRDFVLTYPPDDPQILLTFRGVYAELLIINEQYEAALQECQQTLAVNTQEEGIYLSRGVAYVWLQQLDQAINDLKILLQKPDPKNYARQLFNFIMRHRQSFQEARVQQNTMIDVMLKDMQPTTQPKITIPAATPTPSPSAASMPATVTPTPPPIAAPTVTPTLPPVAPPAPTVRPAFTPTPIPPTPTPVPRPTMTPARPPDPLLTIARRPLDALEPVLGKPLAEHRGDTTVEHDYEYNGHQLTIGFDKTSGVILSLQMFFLPPVTEAKALARMGLTPRNLTPTVSTPSLKVWKPYGDFAKVRLSLNNGQVLAIIVEP